MDIAIAALAAALLLVLAIAALGRVVARAAREAGRREGGGAEPAGRAGPIPAGGGPAPGACPLCSYALTAGGRVKSDIFPGKGDRIMRIFGCPSCWPPRGAVPRVCPVCGHEIPAEGWAIARYFERPGRKHVHVLGCTGCRGAR